MKRFFVFILGVLILGFNTYANGSQESEASKKVELNFLEVMTNPDRTKVIKGFIAEYEALHPEITINLISPPYEQADNKLTMMLNTNQALDIVEIRDMTVSQFVNNDKLQDLSSMISDWSEANTMLSITKEAASDVGGHPYLIPQFFYIKALFVRTDILKQLGVTEMPETLEDLYKIAKQITVEQDAQFGFDFRGKGNAFKTSDIMILSDIDEINTENLYETSDGESVFSNPDFIKGLKEYADLFSEAAPSDAVNWGFNEQINAFVSGTTPFLIQDPDTVPLVDKQLSRDQYTVIPIPSGKSGYTYLDYGYAGLGIPSYSKHQKESWDFISFMSSSEKNSEFCKQYGTLPIHTTSFTDDPYFSTGVYKAWATSMNTPVKFKFVKYPYSSDKYPGWSQIQEQLMQKVLLGQITPESAAKDWASYWD